MKNCIFSPFCQYSEFDDSYNLNEHELSLTNSTQLIKRKLMSSSSIHISDICGESCPMWNLSLSLLRKNNLLNSNVFSSMNRQIQAEFSKLFDKALNDPSRAIVYTPKKMSCIEASSLLTYYGICLLWRYSLHSIMVYNMNFANYVNDISQTYSYGNSIDSDTPERIVSIQDIISNRFESSRSNVLIVSGLDYVNFKGFKVEKLLDIIGTRESSRLPLIIVSPDLSNLMGEGQSFGFLTGVLKEHKVTDV